MNVPSISWISKMTPSTDIHPLFFLCQTLIEDCLLNDNVINPYFELLGARDGQVRCLTCTFVVKHADSTQIAIGSKGHILPIRCVAINRVLSIVVYDGTKTPTLVDVVSCRLQRCQEDGQRKQTVWLNTFFLTQLTGSYGNKGYDYETVKKWTSKRG